MKCALSIAATDSSNGAGLGADLRVFSDLGVYGLSAATCVTSQNSLGVDKIFRVAPRIITAQIDAVAKDFEISACKIGMLFSHQNVDVVIDRINRRKLSNIVLDPVIWAKDKNILLTPTAIKRMKKRLLPLVDLLTPNAAEAEAFCGIEVSDIDSAKEAAKAICALGVKNVLMKGGHIEGEPVDILYNGDSFIEYTARRMEKNMHGTGCVFSAAITARLALGDELPVAILFAKEYVTNAIEKSVTLGKGNMQFFVADSGIIANRHLN